MNHEDGCTCRCSGHPLDGIGWYTVALVLCWAGAWLLFGCASPDTKPRSFDASTDVSYQDAAPDSATMPDARAPVHDVTPVCADDAAGCPVEPHACPPWCPAGNDDPRAKHIR